jgi:nitrite reductase/ring-hydroxylating ferredoxin subunit/uncharacterized membrane protein
MAEPSPTPSRPLVDALERATVFDAPGAAVGKAVRRLLPFGAVKDALSGTWLGHPVHPPLTDVAIGSFLSASLLDLLGRDSGRASERLLEVGIAAAVPTALTGLNDWADTERGDDAMRRVGLVHASSNVSALALYTASLVARRQGAKRPGRALALAGAGALVFSGHLGGHMSFTRGVGPNQTVFDPGPDEWTTVGQGSDLRDGEPKAVVAQETPVLLLRHGDGIHAVHDRCAHRGCSLSEGTIDGHVVTCRCHGSRFDLRDGSVVRGPATSGQPVLDAREIDGRIEVRLLRRG